MNHTPKYKKHGKLYTHIKKLNVNIMKNSMTILALDNFYYFPIPSTFVVLQLSLYYNFDAAKFS